MGSFNRLQARTKAMEQPSGFLPLDLLDMSPPLRTVIIKIIRKNRIRLTDIIAELAQFPEDIRPNLDELMAKGYIRQIEIRQELWYKVNFGRQAHKTMNLRNWPTLDKLLNQTEC